MFLGWSMVFEEVRSHLVSGSVFKTDETWFTPGLAGSIPVRFR